MLVGTWVMICILLLLVLLLVIVIVMTGRHDDVRRTLYNDL